MSANFSPELEGYSGIQPFRFWCQKVMPLTYDDSLSYYELLCKVVDYLNHTIGDVSTCESNIYNLKVAYDELQDYVNDFIDNLDVQQEIDTALDRMVTDGELDAIIIPHIAPTVTAWLNENVDPAGSAVTVDDSLTIEGSAADAKVVGEKITYLDDSVWSFGKTRNLGYLSGEHEGYSLSNNTPTASSYLSYTDYIEIPANVASVTVTAKTKTGSGNIYSIAPSMYVYNSSKEVIKTFTSSTPADTRTYDLTIPDAKYVRIVQPSATSGIDKIIVFNESNYMQSGGQITSSNYTNFFTDANDAPANKCYNIIADVTSSMIANLPLASSNSILFTIAGKHDGTNVKFQLYTASSKTYFRRSNYSGTWSDWFEFATMSDIAANSLIGGELNSSNYSDYFTDADNAEINKVFLVLGNVTSGMVANLPVYDTNGILFTLCGRTNGTNVKSQIYTTGTASYVRSCNYNSVWTKWAKNYVEYEYHVGTGREYTSLTQCLYDLRDNVENKVIYVDGGEYDIFQEYVDAEIPVIPDDGDYNNGYAPYCVWVPKNTKLIGLGNVVLKWTPDASDISAAESKTVSPLNVHNTCYIENFTVVCKNGRYCLHMDGGGSSSYSNAIMKFKNVHFIRQVNTKDGAWGEVIGVGLDKRQYLEFDGCIFERQDEAGTTNFYVHNRDRVGGVALTANDSSTMVIKNCAIFNSGTATSMIKLSSGSTTNLLRIRTMFESCYINGSVHLYERTSGAPNCFDVTILKSGNPTVTVDDSNNIYPVKVYQ